jgi:hypothetical protein
MAAAIDMVPSRYAEWPKVTSRGGAFAEDIWMTAGSCTGMYLPEAAGRAVGKFDGPPDST